MHLRIRNARCLPLLLLIASMASRISCRGLHHAGAAFAATAAAGQQPSTAAVESGSHCLDHLEQARHVYQVHGALDTLHYQVHRALDTLRDTVGLLDEGSHVPSNNVQQGSASSSTSSSSSSNSASSNRQSIRVLQQASSAAASNALTASAATGTSSVSNATVTAAPLADAATDSTKQQQVVSQNRDTGALVAPNAGAPTNASVAAPSISDAVNTSAAAAAPDPEDPTHKITWDAEPTYSSHYSSNSERPNICKVSHRIPARLGTQLYNFTAGQRDYVPYVGTSVVRDSQMLLMRLYYSLRYPVQWLVVVVGQQAATGRNAIAYQLKHMQEFPQDRVGLVIITCEHHPAVTESWNAIFQTFKDEPWGVYMSRDTFWEPGALRNLSAHGWHAAETGEVELAFVKWSNMGLRDAIHNIFMLTGKAIKRFGLFDENIYPAFCEDFDMILRGRVMDPPTRETQYLDVLAVHGKRADVQYKSGTLLPDDTNLQDEKSQTSFTMHRANPNCNYFMRKWGCPSEIYGDWAAKSVDCRFKTPFNRTVPHWYWHTSKALRARDQWLKVHAVSAATPNGIAKQLHLIDDKSKQKIFQVPRHYGEWGGYFEQTRICRISGYLGRTTGSDGRTMCL